MSEAPAADFTLALQLTIEMLDAAAGGNWDRVSQLDTERQRYLRGEPGSLSEHDRQIVATLRRHNQTLLAHAEAAQSTIKQELEQHRYTHRALRSYIASSR